MKHLIIVKWNEKVKDKKTLEQEALSLFKKAENLPEIKAVNFFKNVVELPNRYDCIFEIDLDKEKLPIWSECEVHKTWKKDYAQYLESKAIIDL